MTQAFPAVYEKGVLRLLTPARLNEGDQVQVIIIPPKATGEPESPAEIMGQIASLPVEGSGDPWTSRDHDRVLYGEKGLSSPIFIDTGA
jgi:predicted DNA-binding antitoxin AbrB/MazE fold protein